MVRISEEELIGKKFGKRTVIKEVPTTERFARFFEVKCDCGNINTIRLSAMKGNRAKQCKACALWNYKRDPSKSRFF